MNSPVIQIFYIIAGVIFALIIDAASKYVVPNINKKPMNGVHIIYCILTPLVIWQFIFQFILLFVFFLMAIISKIVYPSSVKDYSIEDEDYNKHIKENRHLFFILLAIYLFVLTWAYKSLFGKLGFDDYMRVGMGVIIILFGAMFYIIRKKNIDFTFPIIEQKSKYLFYSVPLRENLRKRKQVY